LQGASSERLFSCASFIDAGRELSTTKLSMLVRIRNYAKDREQFQLLKKLFLSKVMEAREELKRSGETAASASILTDRALSQFVVDT